MKARLTKRCALIAGSLALACSNGDVSDNTPPPTDVVQDLGAPSGTIREEFTAPTQLIELADGRAVINDPPHNEAWLVDFDSGDRTAFGRTGDGPGEHRASASVFGLTGDSIVIASAGPAPRLSVVTLAGVPARTAVLEAARFSPTSAASSTFSEWPPQPTASDAAGRLYGVRPRVPAGLEPLTEQDQQRVLLRFTLDSGRVDTIATLLPTNVRNARPTASGLEMDLPLGPLEISHAWVVLPDGTVAVIDERTYALTLYPVDASAINVGTVAHDTVPLSEADWRAYVDSSRSAVLASMKGAPTMMQGGGTPAISVREPAAPKSYPPVLADQDRRVLTDGVQLWVPVPGADPPRSAAWDVVDRKGRVQARFAMPVGTRLLAVTERYLYATVESVDGLKQLQRFARMR